MIICISIGHWTWLSRCLGLSLAVKLRRGGVWEAYRKSRYVESYEKCKKGGAQTKAARNSTESVVTEFGNV